MNENFEERSEELDLIRKFEEMLGSNQTVFFDLSDFELIIDHYTSNFNYSKALTACDSALAQYPFSTELLIDKAQVLAMAGEFEEALTVINAVADVDPLNPDLLITRGVISTQQGEFRQAVDFFKQAAEVSQEQREDIYFNIGLAYQNCGKFGASIKYYKKCLSLNPANDQVLQELLYCLDITGTLQEEEAFFQKFVDDDPYNPVAWYNLGQVYYKLEQIEKAVGAFEYATLIKADYPEAQTYLATAFVANGEYLKAIEAFQASVEKDKPNAEVYCNIGECYEKLQQWDLARKYYQKALDLDPLMDEAWFGIGIILDAQGKWFEAIHFYRKAVSLYDDSAEYWMALATAEYNVGNVVSSLEAYEKASQILPDNKDIWLNWSVILYEQGNYEGAIDLMLTAIELQPAEAELYYRACVYMLSAGKYKEAYNYLENALILDFDKHRLIYDFFPELESQRALSRLIDQYRK
ncbi:MAG: tetratricopeptide repeat protein [Hymenobacteraceae bacterium]|nr:tetratricopeptide repeat protein [Hymenobacteraceae bacterium]